MKTVSIKVKTHTLAVAVVVSSAALWFKMITPPKYPEPPSYQPQAQFPEQSMNVPVNRPRSPTSSPAIAPPSRRIPGPIDQGACLKRSFRWVACHLGLCHSVQPVVSQRQQSSGGQGGAPQSGSFQNARPIPHYPKENPFQGSNADPKCEKQLAAFSAPLRRDQ
jgi:hypothetical protein